MMKTVNLAPLAIAICFATACNSFVTTTLEPDFFEKTLRQAPDPQLVDVRTPKEFSEGYIPGAVLIDVKAADFDTKIQALDRTRPVFVYCRSGKRSLEAAAVLEKNKFKVIYDLGGGINAWKEKGKPITMP